MIEDTTLNMNESPNEICQDINKIQEQMAQCLSEQKKKCAQDSNFIHEEISTYYERNMEFEEPNEVYDDIFLQFSESRELAKHIWSNK